MPAMDTEFENLRDNVAAQYAELSDDQLRAVFQRSGMDAEAMEGFFDDLGKFAATAGKAVLKAAPSILPVAGSILGTAFGGPLGASLGGSLGSLAGNALGAATGQPPAGGGGGGASGGSPAAGQLLQTLTKPETIQAVTSMAMGAMGKPDVSVGGTQVPVAAFGNLLKMLMGQAEAEYAEAMANAEGDGTPAYMKDFAGQPVADPAVPMNRAMALLQMLQTTSRHSKAEASEAEADAEAEAEAAELEMAEMHAEYDEMELMEAYESEDA